MTQRVFDIENEKDMQDLWEILQNHIIKLVKPFMNGCLYPKYVLARSENGEYELPIDINWHDKSEITRPIQEATEQDIGKLCYFWDGDINKKFIGIFRRKTLQGKYICDFKGWIFHHCRRLTKQEIEELC